CAAALRVGVAPVGIVGAWARRGAGGGGGAHRVLAGIEAGVEPLRCACARTCELEPPGSGSSAASPAWTWAGRSMLTNIPRKETAASTHSATCMLAMKGSSFAAERPLVTPEKIANSAAWGTAEVTTAITKAIDSTAPVFCRSHQGPAAIPRRWAGTTPIIAAVLGLLNMPEPTPTN